MKLTPQEARAIVVEALDQLGGPSAVYRSPRHPFSLWGTRTLTVGPYEVRVRYGEVSAPAVAEVEGFVFEIRGDDFILLFAPS